MFGPGKQLSLRETAALLRVSVQTLRRWDQAGKLPSRRNPLNDYRYYLEEDLASLLAPQPAPRMPTIPAQTQPSVPPGVEGGPAVIEPLECARAADLADGPAMSQWLIDGIWGHEAVGIIGGEPKCCKSFLALDLAVAVASGRPCLRRYAVSNPGPVLLFAAEDPPHVVRERLRGICAAAETELATLEVHVVRSPSIRLDLEADRERLRQAIDKLRPRLLVLDPFIRLHRISESAVGEVARVLGFLREIQRAFGTAVCLVHHMRKSAGNVRGGQALRGSSEFHAWGDSNLYLRRRDALIGLHIEHRAAASHEGDLALELHSDEGALALRVSDRPASDRNDEPEGELKAAELAPDERILRILGTAASPTSFHALRRTCGMKTATFSTTLRNLVAGGFVTRTEAGYSLPAQASLVMDATAVTRVPVVTTSAALGEQADEARTSP